MKGRKHIDTQFVIARILLKAIKTLFVDRQTNRPHRRRVRGVHNALIIITWHHVAASSADTLRQSRIISGRRLITVFAVNRSVNQPGLVRARVFPKRKRGEKFRDFNPRATTRTRNERGS